MGIANASYEFSYINIGAKKRNSNGGVTERAEFYGKLEDRSLNTPQTEGSCNAINIKYMFVGDKLL
jgi:hypothetical protein